MTAKLGFKEGIVSAFVFGTILFGLVSVDPRVRDQVNTAFRGGVSPLGERVGDVGSAIVMAARDQGLDNAPLLVFATVGTVLTVFMLRS